MITKYRYTSPQATAKQQESVPTPTLALLPLTAPRAQSNFTFRRICCLCEPFWHNKKFSRSCSPSHLLTLSFSLCFVYFFLFFGKTNNINMDFSLKCQSYARAEAASKSRLPGSFAWCQAQALQGLSLVLLLSLCCLCQCQCRGIAWQLSLFLSECALSLFAALLLVACSTAKSRAAIEGISLPVCRFCRSVSLLLSLPLSHHFIALSLSHYLCLPSRLTLWHDNVTHLSWNGFPVFAVFV